MTDLVAVGILPSFAVKGLYLLLGNDLARHKVVVNPLLTNVPCINQPLDPIERETPGFYASFAITITMSKKAKQNDGDIDSFLGQSFKKTVGKITFRSNSENLVTVIKELAIAWIPCGRLHA